MTSDTSAENSCPITYEELRDLEQDFEDAETEITRQHLALTKPLYEKREKTVSQIPNFWALVFEQAPPDVDQYIHPTDSAVFLSSLKKLTVSHFELENNPKGDPRSVAIKFEFDENEYFEDRVLEKKFWYRQSKDGRSGLVSEPVPIKWKEGKDLTEGILDLVAKVWQQDKSQANGDSSKPKKIETFTPDEKALKEKIAKTGLGGMSFFTWFGYRGPRVSEEESRLAIEKEREARRLRAEGKATKKDGEEEEEDDEDDEDESLALEIFPDGEELAVAISEDLWPNAIKYFTQGQEAAELSDLDFEELDEDEMEEDDEDDEENDNVQRPSKKQRT
ncbi:hypothetical protein DL764_006212 [Monosporascus ibericus]|uniref:Nap family protein n=1 Tax=Monosporascus ibericus TaxID=155417 RepID=A0A4Q4T7X1_9PEZI|nr:hypothetical protein DL764_006212 [Monosporascus ibericus]